MNSTSEKQNNHYTIAFYNLENLFDTKDDPKTLDDDFTEGSQLHWNSDRFSKKIKKLGRVISSIGYQDVEHPPVIIGVAEVENKQVLEALVNSKFLKERGYSIVHFDSPDERGIDTALLYRHDYFSVLKTKAHTVYIEVEGGVRDYTRDVLHVFGTLQGEEVHILVNHWPSRRAGATATNARRLVAATTNREVIARIVFEDPNAKIIVMGDFNDDPSSESIAVLKSTDLYNPMDVLLTRQEGSTIYRRKWNLFDQILVSNNFFKTTDNRFRFEEAKIFNPKELQEFEGKYKGNPFRTFAGKKYLGGISDHFPVYSIFSITA